MVMLARKRVFAAKIETTVGTPETLAGGDGAFNAYDVMAQAQIEVEDREGQGAFNYLSGVPGARQGTLSFSTDLGWDGTATLPTWATVLFPACGLVESAGVFTPRTEAPGTNVKTATIAVYIDGIRKILAGAVGTFQLIMPTGRMAHIDWTFTGVWQPPTDTPLLSPTYPTAKPLRFASGSITYNGVALKVESATLNIGNEVVMRECPTTAAGFISGLVTNRQPRLTANPESVLVATQDRFGQWLAADEEALAITINGPSDSNISISCPKAQIINVQESDRNRMVVDDVEWSLNKNAANNDQEVSITFNEASP